MRPMDAISMANAAQQEASNPYISAWVSASAGSGKTKVLTDRVLNLLLTNYPPEKILCLTFTKTAAAEMANRLSEILQKWTVLDDAELTKALIALKGDDFEPEHLNLARRLFAKLLDVKGGMKIMTIHSFCQSLLKRFPLEAGLSSSFDVLDDKDSSLYMSRAIADGLKEMSFAPQMALVSNYMNEKSFADLMKTFDSERNQFKRLLEAHQSLSSLIEKVYHTLNVSPDMTVLDLQKTVYDGDDFDAFQNHYLTKEKEIRKKLKPEEIPVAKALVEVLDRIKALQTAEATAAFLTIGFHILDQYQALKKENDVLDYDDLILYTRQLLEESNMASWVLYKLDGGIDHILVDEAQDTSPDQWAIIRKLTEDFFSGETKSEVLRTLFVVGDKKQSIYSFQGADPQEFEKMCTYFQDKIDASQNEFKKVPLNISFRSTQAVLDLVNLLLQNKQAAQGVLNPKEDAVHLPARTGEAGLIEIWPLETQDKKATDEAWQLPLLQESTPTASVKLAKKIAARIHQMIGHEILPSQNRPIQAGDIMILVQRRNQFIFDLVRALKEKHIPVAGVDRLILTNHIAVMDLMSLGAFLLLPEDDLRLAEILKSPLCGLTEEQLFDISYKRTGSLWNSLKQKQPVVYEKLAHLLNLTDTMPPFELFSYILGKMDGRTQFLKRLGYEANEALDEFLNLALQFEQTHVPSLQSFLKWLSAGEIEIKRDLDQNAPDAVRIMTVHGSKGLQSNIVFLPDTRRKPNTTPPLVWMQNLPVWIPKKETRPSLCDTSINSIKYLEEQEYNRLLYVAVTRARDRLYVCGYDGGKTASANNWYELIAQSLPHYRADEITRLSCEQTKTDFKESSSATSLASDFEIPAWFYQSAPEEPVPPKPLTPSKPALDEPAAPSPLTEAQKEAMRRGTFIHKALQILPTLPTQQRKDWLCQATPEGMEVPVSLLTLLENPALKPLFSEHSMPEVPIIGTVNGFVVSGQVDRLLVTDDAVFIIDYKTNKTPPQTTEDIPPAYIHQMHAYKSLLKNLFPAKKITCYLLWTQNLSLMEVV